MNGKVLCKWIMENCTANKKLLIMAKEIKHNSIYGMKFFMADVNRARSKGCYIMHNMG